MGRRPGGGAAGWRGGHEPVGDHVHVQGGQTAAQAAPRRAGAGGPAIEQLARDPRPHGVEALQGVDALRLRIGAYRVLYRLKDEALVVLVLRPDHRRDVYER